MTPLPNSAWIAHYRSHPQAKLRLFCLAYAGGAAHVFRDWHRALPPEIEVCPIQLPGRDNRMREAPFQRIDTLVTSLAHALAPWLTEPFAIFGHSMGALVAFELTRHLRRQQSALPALLLVAGHRAPQLPDGAMPRHQLPDDAFIEELRKFDGTPPAVLENQELMQLLLPTIRADFAVCETYDYRVDLPLPCPIAAFGGFADQEVSRDELFAWREQTAAWYKLHMLPGGHFFLHSSLPLLLRAIAGDIAQVL